MKHKDGELEMTRKEFLGEHKKLVKILKHPTKRGLKQEAKEQGKELRQEKKRKR